MTTVHSQVKPLAMNAAEAQQLAQDAAAAMWSRDHAAQALGMAIAEVAPGSSRLTMVVRQDMVNGHAICHGGMLFTLADTFGDWRTTQKKFFADGGIFDSIYTPQ